MKNFDIYQDMMSLSSMFETEAEKKKPQGFLSDLFRAKSEKRARRIEYAGLTREARDMKDAAQSLMSGDKENAQKMVGYVADRYKKEDIGAKAKLILNKMQNMQ